MILCVALPLLTLRAALGERPERPHEPVAVAPGSGGPARIGEVSPAARALGVGPGMRLGEAMDICPGLTLLPPDPVRAAAIQENLLLRLESIGAAVESERPGEVFLSTGGIEPLYGGLDGVLAAARGAVGPEPVLAAATTRLAAFALAGGEAGHPVGEIVAGEATVLPSSSLRGFLAALPTRILSGRLGIPTGPERRLFNSMGRLGLDRLGDLTALTADQIADRFGPAGTRARRLALGREDPLRPRRPRHSIGAALDLPEDASGTHLQAGLTLLCDRIATRLNTAGLTARALVLEAGLVGGGSWRRELVPRRPTDSPQLLGILLAPVPEQIPRPARNLSLRVTAAAPAAPEQLEVAPRPGETRRIRLDEAARQVRAAVGETGLMRVLEAESGSRLPERRVVLAPYLPE